MSVVQTQRGIEQRAQHTNASLVVGFVALAVLPIIILLTLCVILPPNALNGPIEDDAYYYARVAKNLAQGNGSTFGGLVLTNGYHPLWQIILALLHCLTKNEDYFIFLVMIVSCLSWVACVELLRRIGNLCGAQASFLLAGLYAAYLLTFMTPGSAAGLLFLGMESTVAVPLLLAVVYVSLARDLYARASATDLVTIGCVSVVLVSARLDAIFFVGAFVPSIAWKRRRLRDGIVTGLPIAFTLGVYMTANFVLFGMPTPVSGAAKALWAPFFNADALWTSITGSTPSVVGNLGEVAKSVPIGYAFMAVIAVSLFFGRMPIGQRAVDSARRQLGTLLLVLLAANLFHLAYLTVGSSWPPSSWYAYLRAVLGILLLGFMLAAMPARLSPRLAAGLVSTALFLGGAVSIIKFLNLGLNDNEYGVYVEEAAADLNRQLPPDSVVAMGDLAGGLGYRLDRPMVQLEGLVETSVYLRMLSEGRAHQYLR